MRRLWLLIVPWALLACGGAPTGPSPRGGGGPLSATLISDGAVSGVAYPEALGARLRPLRPWMAGIPRWVEGAGLAPDRPVWFSLRAGGSPGAIRAGEDIARIAAALLDDGRAGADTGPFRAWLARYPSPEMWLHLRLAGAPADLSSTPRALGEHFGGALVATLDDPLEIWVSTLAISPRRALTLKTRLSGRHTPGLEVAPEADDFYLVRLLGLPTPTMVLIRRGPDRVICDWLFGFTPSPGTFATALEGLDDLPLAAPASAPRVAGAPPLLAGTLDLARWGQLVRALGEISWLQRALAPAARALPTADPRQHAERWMKPALRWATEAHLRVTWAPGRRLSLRLRAPLSAPDAGLPPLGAPPVSHDLLVGAAPYRASIPLAPPGPRRLPEGLVGGALACGPLCWPALWGAAPALLADARHWLAEAPALAPLAEGLEAAEGVNLLAGEVGFAALLSLPDGAPSPWAGVDERLTTGALERPSAPRAWAGDRLILVDRLARLARQPAPRAPAPTGAHLTLDLSPTQSASVETLGLDLSLTPREMILDVTLRLRRPPSRQNTGS